MKPSLALFSFLSATLSSIAHAHLIGDPTHNHAAQAVATERAATGSDQATAPAQAASFAAFAPNVLTHTDADFLYIESSGLPAHRMMVGITAWQQQVPLPQPYVGANAWRIPLRPVPAAEPLSAKTHFFRGAIAIAANGIPIFNPIKNDGRTDTFLAGELDEFGGHCGRADDYHYHIAPTHLQAQVGPALPIAYALDGYAIYGFNEPDGTPARELDAFNGHTTPALGYHYHATKAYPYLNGGFHGEVTERDGQVDPQPRAQPVRPFLPPLRGAKITGFTVSPEKQISVRYEQSGADGFVNYKITKDSVAFDFIAPDGTKKSETYDRTSVRQADNASSNASEKPSPEKRERTSPEKPRRNPDPASGPRQPWLKVHAAEMDASHDGTLSAAELDAEISRTFAGYDQNSDGQISRDELAHNVRSALGGFVKEHTDELDADHDQRISRDELRAVPARMFAKLDTDHDGQLSPAELAPSAAESTSNSKSRPAR